MTHAELVQRAVKWLAESQGCQIVLAEQGGGLTSEMPDAIGWKDGVSVLVECKTSIEDLKADFKKPWRMYPDLGVGQFRWYMVPKELEKKVRDELVAQSCRRNGGTPQSCHDYLYRWGLLVCHPTMVKVSEDAAGWHSKWEARKGRISELGKEYERQMLLAALSRIAWKLGPVTLSGFLRMSSRDMVEVLHGAHPEQMVAMEQGVPSAETAE
jgi:hypothetical protein